MRYGFVITRKRVTALAMFLTCCLAACTGHTNQIPPTLAARHTSLTRPTNTAVLTESPHPTHTATGTAEPPIATSVQQPTLASSATFTPVFGATPPATRRTALSASLTPTGKDVHATAAPLARAAVVTSDGISLTAELHVPSGSGPFPGVILSHMAGSNRAGWGALPEALRESGFLVLLYDLRGHGESAGELDPRNAATDLNAALRYLRSFASADAQRVGLVGASMGGMSSVIVGASDPLVRAVVAISTSPGAAGQNPINVIGQLSPRPFLAIGCDGDPITSPERVLQLYDAADLPKSVVILGCDVHANDIFTTSEADTLIELVVGWLNQYLGNSPRSP